MWLESQIYDLRNRYLNGMSICDWRVKYMASETDMWLESQVKSLRNIYVAGESDIWPRSGRYIKISKV